MSSLVRIKELKGKLNEKQNLNKLSDVTNGQRPYTSFFDSAIAAHDIFLMSLLSIQLDKKNLPNIYNRLCFSQRNFWVTNIFLPLVRG